MSNDDLEFCPSPSSMDEEGFVRLFGGVYEHSPWIAKQTWQQGLDSSHDTVAGLAQALQKTVDSSEQDKKLKLINAHPDLAGRAAIAGELTAESTTEQASAGIDQCTAQEFERFQSLNEQYKSRFGIVFVMAVKNSNRHKIMQAFETRLGNDQPTEFATAIREIHKIARLRLEEIAATQCRQLSSSCCSPGDNQNMPAFCALTNLALPRLGAEVVYATDDFFADKSRLIEPKEPVFIEDKYDDHGKWMDGWESRRKRTSGHDHCVIHLGVPGIIRGVAIDTSHFTGNFPPAASLDACVSSQDIPGEEADWVCIVDRAKLQGDSILHLAVDDDRQFTHVRLNIYPDGGIARLRIYGEISRDWQQYGDDEVIDLLAVENGGRALLCNDEHYGSMQNLNAPGRGINMGDGWETARRREPGNDWVIMALGHAGNISRIEIDTAHFKGNYPDRAVVQAALLDEKVPMDLQSQSNDWQTLLPEVSLGADAQHYYDAELKNVGPVTHLRINIYPDGGISRIRAFGTLYR